jgi:hypothetical protein
MEELRFFIVEQPRKTNRPRMKSEQEIIRRVEWVDRGPGIEPGCCHKQQGCGLF